MITDLHSLTFDDDHLSLLEAFAMHAAAAISNRRKLDQVGERISQLDALRIVAAELIASRDVQRVLRVIAHEALRHTTGFEILIYLYDSAHDRLGFGASLRADGTVDHEFAPPRPDGVTMQVARTGQARVIDDPQHDPAFKNDSRTQDWAKVTGLVSIPLKSLDGVIGVFNVLFDDRPMSEEATGFLEMLASQAVIAIENARLYEISEQHADHLEHLVNERTLALSREREYLKTVLESAGDGIVSLKADGTIKLVNCAWEQIIGFKAAEVEGKNILEVFGGSPELSAGLEKIRHLPVRRGVWEGEIRGNRPDGAYYDVAVTISPVLDIDGSLIECVGVFRDVTTQKTAERMRAKFLANVSHELRTPITSLKLYHDLLREADPKKQNGYWEAFSGELNRLQKLVDDLLDISKMDRGAVTLNLELFDMNRLVDEVVDLYRLRATENGIDLVQEMTRVPLRVFADRSKLAQVITNLLGNAIYHSTPGQKVVVSTVQTFHTERSMVMVKVSDSGAGISPEDLPFIFDRFFRGGENGSATRLPGTGLGLSIAREIVDMHQGDIEVETRLGHGSVFSVFMPTAHDPSR
jgi:two-component system sensor histidine kinase ResE